LREKTIGHWISCFRSCLDMLTVGWGSTTQLRSRTYMSNTEIVNQLLSNNYSTGCSTRKMEELMVSIHTFKSAVWRLFGPHCENGLNTLKFHLLDHLVDELARFGTVLVLSASPYEHFNLIVKQSYASTSKRLQTRTSDTVRNSYTSLCRQKQSTITASQKTPSKSSPRIGVVQNGETICFP